MHCINNMNGIASGLIIASCVFYSCTSRTGEISPVHEQQQTDSLSQNTITQPEVKPVEKKLTAEQIQITKDLLYDQYTLEDTYPYKTLPGSFNGTKSKNGWLCLKIYNCSLPLGQFSRITKIGMEKHRL